MWNPIHTTRRLVVAIASAILAIPVLCLLGYLLSGGIIWLPDLVTPHSEHVIARAAINGGEVCELTQTWAGDGYMTGVRHRLADGTSSFAVGDGDARRAFGSTAQVDTNHNSVTFQFSGRRWRYYWHLRSLSFDTGGFREAR